MTFEEELESGFAELADIAGAAATFGDTALQVVVSAPTAAQQQVDIAMGRPYVVRIEVARSTLPTIRPKVGEVIDIGGIKHDIADILKHDPTDPTIVYICRTTGKP